MRLTSTQARIAATLLGSVAVSAMSIAPLSPVAADPSAPSSTPAESATSTDLQSNTSEGSSVPKAERNTHASPEAAEEAKEAEESSDETISRATDTAQSIEAAQSEDRPQSSDRPQSGEKAQSGESAFLQARAVGDSLFPPGLNTCTPGEFWELGSQGQIQKIVDGKVAQTYDIPIGSFQWLRCRPDTKTNKCLESQSIFNTQGAGWIPVSRAGSSDGMVDGLARSDGGIFAVQSRGAYNSPDGSGVLLHYRTGGDWYAVRPNGSLELNRWGTSSFQNAPLTTTQAPAGPGNSYTGIPTVKEPPALSPTVNYNNGARYTFNNAYTNFTMGTALPDGTYIFGGPAGSGGKLFARKPNGQIVYLGYMTQGAIPGSTAAASQSGDIVADSFGNVYVANGAVNGTSLTVNLSRIDAADIQMRLRNPAAIWNGSSWVNVLGGAFSHSVNNLLGTAVGSNTAPIPANRIATLPVPGATQTTPSPNLFNGFDISPNGNIILSIRSIDESKPNRENFNFVAEFTPDGQVVNNTAWNNNNLNLLQLWDAGNGVYESTRPKYGESAGLNKEITDIVGCPGAPPMRKITIIKDLERRVASADQFSFTASINNGARTLSGSTSGNATGQQTITMSDTGDASRNLPSRNIKTGAVVILTETAKPGTNTNLDRYDTTVKCYDKDSSNPTLAFYDQARDGNAMTIPYPPANYNSNNDPATNVDIPGIQCVFTNAPKVRVDIRLTKKDGSNNSVMSNVPFSLHKDNGSGTAHDPNFKIPTQPGGNTFNTATNAAGQATWAQVEPGIYWIVEDNAPEGYELLPPQKVEVVKTDPAVKAITLTNTRKTGTLNIEKISAGDRTKLAGSKWRLRGTTDAAARYNKIITDFAGNGAAPSTSNDANNAAGVIQVNDLPWGKYILTEEEAPAGFERSSQQWEFTISATTLIQNFVGNQAIVNTPYPGPAIPFTGGLGRDGFIIGGIIFLGGAAGVSWAFGRKRRPVPSETDVPNAR